MKKFLLKSTLYLSVLLVLHYAAAWQADGYIDPFYLRFTNGKLAGMIVGTSRAAQGMMPTVINEELGADFAPIGNYSFTVSHSPYGPAYFESLQKKILEPTEAGQNRVFILSVDPWSVSNFKNPQDDPALFREKDLILGKIKRVSVARGPNFEYLLRNFPNAWGSMFFHLKTSEVLHQDGWLEITIPMDSAEVAKRTQARIRDYTENTFPYTTFSPTRFAYLERTIRFLQSYGAVYLVRLPAHPQLLALEEQIMPDFNQKLCSLAQTYRIPYWDFMPQAGQYTFTDGNHLYKESAEKVSRTIAQRIFLPAPGDCP